MANSRRFQTVLHTRANLLQMRTLVLECGRVSRYHTLQRRNEVVVLNGFLERLSEFLFDRQFTLQLASVHNRISELNFERRILV
jgi:hypothetical protein